MWEQERPVLSIVIPLYNEREGLPELFRRLEAVLGEIPEPAEIICVDDGSHDGTADYCRSRAAEDQRVKLLRLSRNFGHQAAISAGLAHASGDAILVMDGDLQDPPEVIPDLIAKWREGFDVVYVVRRSRPERWTLRAAFWLFYRLLDRVASLKIPRDTGDFALMDRQVVDHLLRMPERNRFLRGLRSWVGLRQTGIDVDRGARQAGEPKYTFSKHYKLAMDGFISFSYIPLRLSTRVGFLISAIAFCYAAWAAIRRIIWGAAFPGFAAIVVVVALLGGIQLITIGVMGEYIGRIYDEVKRRPLYLVAEAVNLSDRTNASTSLPAARRSADTGERRL